MNNVYTYSDKKPRPTTFPLYKLLVNKIEDGLFLENKICAKCNLKLGLDGTNGWAVVNTFISSFAKMCGYNVDELDYMGNEHYYYNDDLIGFIIHTGAGFFIKKKSFSRRVISSHFVTFLKQNDKWYFFDSAIDCQKNNKKI